MLEVMNLYFVVGVILGIISVKFIEHNQDLKEFEYYKRIPHGDIVVFLMMMIFWFPLVLTVVWKWLGGNVKMD